jgi:hypothetical protein
MRFAVIIAAIVLIAGGGFGAHYAASPDTSDNALSVRYLSLAHRNPNAIIRHIAEVMPVCLPEKDRLYVADPAILQLGAKTFMKSIALIAEDKLPEEMSSELIPFVIKEAEGLSAKQQQDFLALANNGLRDQNTIFCVMSAIKTSMDQRMDMVATDWRLRS